MGINISLGNAKPGKGGSEYVRIDIIPLKFDVNAGKCKQSGKKESIRLNNATAADMQWLHGWFFAAAQDIPAAQANREYFNTKENITCS